MTQIFYGIQHLPEVQHAVSICFDTETLQLKPEVGKLRLLQLGSAALETIVVIDLFDLTIPEWGKLEQFFTNGERFWLAHNAVFDLAWLQEHGLYPRGNVRCSMIASKLLHNGIPNIKHSLKAVAKRELDIELDKEQQASDWGAKDLSDEQIDYAAKDVEALMELDAPLHSKLQREKLALAYSIECRALPAMAQMWRTGLPWNITSLDRAMADYKYDGHVLGEQFLRDLDAAMPAEHKLPRDPDGSFNTRAKTEGSVRLGTKKFAGFNLNSPAQLLHKFTVLLGKQPWDEKNDRASASRSALKPYAADNMVVGTYLQWKKKSKLEQMCKSLTEKVESDSFVRASYAQLGAETGRMTCSNPNLQQVPRDKELRSCVEAPEGWVLVNADFAQMELRLAAAVANDRLMIEAFKEGKDLHSLTAEALGCDRQIAKSANFGLLYGSGAKGLRNYAGSTGVLISLRQAEKIRRDWLNTYQGIARWQREQAQKADQTAREKMSELRIPLSNMRRLLPPNMNRLTVRANSPIQGAGAAVLKVALGNLWRCIGNDPDVKIAAAVHDEIILLAREEKAEFYGGVLKDCMESAEAKWLDEIPAVAEVKIGKTWDETH